MQVKLIHHTPNYHKLVETVARVCYQSYNKDDEKSHNFIKAIMAKGHISVASVGNMVFEFETTQENAFGDIAIIVMDLVTMHEITQFIKWSFPDEKKNLSQRVLISMNMLTFLDVYKEKDSYEWASNLLDLIIAETDKVPYLKWFYDKSVQLDESPNEYTAKGMPTLYNPMVLDEDYTALKALGLNDYELGIHAQITLNFISDRAAGLQFWRHWAGGCELSQRYVERGNAEFREMVGLADYIEKFIDEHKGDVLTQQIAMNLKSILYCAKENVIGDYESIIKICKKLGIRKNRAKEIARSILPNNITTQIIQSRPYRNWQHLFNLRDTNHAQAEIREDVKAMKQLLSEMKVISGSEVVS